MSAENYRVARRTLQIEIYEQRQGANPMALADAIEKFVLAAITEAFRTHPATAASTAKEPNGSTGESPARSLTSKPATFAAVMPAGTSAAPATPENFDE